MKGWNSFYVKAEAYFEPKWASLSKAAVNVSLVKLKSKPKGAVHESFI